MSQLMSMELILTRSVSLLNPFHSLLFMFLQIYFDPDIWRVKNFYYNAYNKEVLNFLTIT